LWAHLKSVIYAKKPVDIPELKKKKKIKIHAIIPPDMLKNAMN
jgi:hypothetical protein